MRKILILAVAATGLIFGSVIGAQAKTEAQCRAESYEKYPPGSLSRNKRANMISGCMVGKAVLVKETDLKTADAWMKRCLRSYTEHQCQAGYARRR